MQQIAVIDDHVLFSSGLVLLLAELEPKVAVTAYETIDAFFANKDIEHDLVILDFYLPGTDFCNNQLKLSEDYPDLPIIIVSASPSPADRLTALSCGAAAFLNKNIDPSILLDTVSRVLKGEAPISSQPHKTKTQLTDSQLTQRQIEILTLVSKGYSNKDIGNILEVSPETVKSHLKSIFQRIQVGNRMEAIEYIRQHGLI